MESLNKEDWYSGRYNQVNATAIPNSISSRILHKFIEKKFKTNLNKKILEVGGNTGEHLPYVIDDYQEYVLTDIRRPKLLSAKLTKKISFKIADLHDLSFGDETFDRVISTCVFHHLSEPEVAMMEVRRVTKVGGKISILLPNDPGLMYRFLRGATTLRKARKLGIRQEVQLFHAREHRNHYLSLKTMIMWVFRDDKIEMDSFPWKFSHYNLNAITSFTITKRF